jgi:hypothetical protein
MWNWPMNNSVFGSIFENYSKIITCTICNVKSTQIFTHRLRLRVHLMPNKCRTNAEQMHRKQLQFIKNTIYCITMHELLFYHGHIFHDYVCIVAIFFFLGKLAVNWVFPQFNRQDQKFGQGGFQKRYTCSAPCRK